MASRGLAACPLADAPVILLDGLLCLAELLPAASSQYVWSDSILVLVMEQRKESADPVPAQ
jgi:hypothetical protein